MDKCRAFVGFKSISMLFLGNNYTFKCIKMQQKFPLPGEKIFGAGVGINPYAYAHLAAPTPGLNNQLDSPEPQ
jgi:hypothetical protein